MRVQTCFIFFLLLSGCSSEPIMDEQNAEQSETTVNKLMIEQTKCDNEIRLDDLTFNSQDWDQMDQSEVFDEIVERIFTEWEKTDLVCMDSYLANLVYACNMNVQVDNGGVISFVDNGSGEYFHETLNALKELKMDKFLLILDEFKTLFPDEIVPKDIEKRRNAIDLILDKTGDSEEPFESWDDIFYSNREYFENKIIEYVKNNTHNIN